MRRLGRRSSCLVALAVSFAVSGCASLAPGAKHGAGTNPQVPPAGPASARVWGRPDAVSGVYDFYIDARTGQTLGAQRFRLDQTVRVVVHDINPFLYNYRLSVDRARIAEASPVEFFNAALGLKLTVPSTGEKSLIIPGTPKTRASCRVSKQAGRLTEQLVVMDSVLRTRDAAINAKIVSLQREAATADKAIQAALRVVFDATQDAMAVHASAGAVDSAVVALDTVYLEKGNEIDSLSTDFEAGVGTFGALRKKGLADFPDCTDLKNLVAEMERQLAKDTLFQHSAREQIGNSRDRIAAMRAVFEPAVTDPLRFYQTYTLPPRRQPTEAEVIVARRALPRVPPSVIARTGRTAEGSATDSAPKAQSASALTPAETPFDTIARHRLVFGDDSHFTAAAGLVWGQIAERDYRTLVEIRPAGGGFADTITTVGYEKNTPGQTAPMLTLNTRVANLERRGWLVDGAHLVLGIGVAATLPTEPKFLLGTALSFFGERVFLNGGAMIGRTERLADGVSINSRLPRGVSNVPTVERVVARPAVALTFRFAPW